MKGKYVPISCKRLMELLKYYLYLSYDFSWHFAKFFYEQYHENQQLIPKDTNHLDICRATQLNVQVYNTTNETCHFYTS